jgi:hypothetical protein
MAEAKHPGGRPTDYDPKYCDMIVEAMTQGKSVAAFAADIGKARSTINYWAEHFPEFSEALKKGKAACAAWWEERIRDIVKGKEGNVTAAIFGLKNMAAEDWKDKHELEHSGNVTVKLVNFSEKDL